MKIILAKKEDAERISELRIKTIKKSLSNEYSKKVIDWLVENNSVDNTLDKISKEKIFCLWEDNQIIGTITFKEKAKNHHHMGEFYVKTTEFGKGHGSKLLEYFEKIAKRKGIKIIRINATNYAFNFYKSMGYKLLEVHTAWKELGTPTKVYEMEKRIQ